MDVLWKIAFFLTAAGAAYLGLRWFMATRDLRRKAAAMKERSLEIEALKAINARLAKFEGVADATETAAALRKENEENRERSLVEAKRIVEDARAKANASLKEAPQTLQAAAMKAAAVIRDAEARAQEIGGDAYKALQNAAFYERTVKAMKNIIEGYGDEYLVPPDSLLDDLAAELSHSAAGRHLKQAREHSKSLVRQGLAGTCDYVEAAKRDTAIKFVVDAFTGRVDSILSRTKEENFGKLDAEIRDAFTIVNYEGKAFRDARVTEAYLNARIDELRWASIAQQLREEEREEQRKLKERLRDEERARREYERAMKDAARDEDLIREATEKARSQLETASAEQRQKYEQQLAELSAKLADAEARSKRALSMAQQTKQGHVYVISNVGSFGENVYKIGLTRRLDPHERVRELGDSSVPFEFDVHALIFAEDAPTLETRLHKHFVLGQMNKVNRRKEFFRADIAHIKKEIEGLGLNASWTMAAAATEYRETLAIEKKIAADPAAREAWIHRQLELEDADLRTGGVGAAEDAVEAEGA